MVIEAVQLRWDTWGEMCDLLGEKFFASGGRGNEGVRDAEGRPRISLLIPTLEGTMQADENDWIIRGVKGELYPCKPDIFAATYEPADV